ncbi:hypothetical protein AB6A40_008064 [Gnathostoma spinigerum]|uniref:CTCHY-type domain-containing protein n=1 Tax=Gnathostoma spinigerum TaxID=75299 RepID=A0ABD6EP90_9BILA
MKTAKETKKKNRRSKKCNHGLAALKYAAVKGGRRQSYTPTNSPARPHKKVGFRRPGTSRRVNTEVEVPSFRLRSNLRIVDPVGVEVPTCPHGPCLLFACQSSEGTEGKFFACSVYRDGTCQFRSAITSNGSLRNISIENDIHQQSDTAAVSSATKRKRSYGWAKRSALKLKSSGLDIYYCSNCNDAVEIPHQHEVIGPLKVSSFRKPVSLLPAIMQNGGEAQYWFTSESLRVLLDAIAASKCDSILCIGTPSIFQHFNQSVTRRKLMNSFLLDIDARWSGFYTRKRFAQYSMLVNHFYDNMSKKKFNNFLLSARHLVIICDPPFGIFVEALANTLAQLSQEFSKIHADSSSRIDYIVALSRFVGKHLDCFKTTINRIDYMVTYENHPSFKSPEKSIVRFFTTLPQRMFKLPEPAYRYCDMCERYVAKNNLHCGICGTCPSPDCSTYRHCPVCSRCVKPSYQHCTSCCRCHLSGRCLKSSIDCQ